MHAAAFSSDGSLLAVAAGAAVTLWDAQSTALLAVLPPPAPPAASGVAAAPLVHLAFLKDSPYLVSEGITHLNSTLSLSEHLFLRTPFLMLCEKMLFFRRPLLKGWAQTLVLRTWLET